MTHWSEWYGCRCGFRTKSYATEARHRHNFPLLCRKPKTRKAAQNAQNEHQTRPILTDSDLQTDPVKPGQNE